MPKPQVIGQPTTTKQFTLGIDAMADLLAPTLGPIGGVVANERAANNKPEILDDSATAMRRNLNLGDPRRYFRVDILGNQLLVVGDRNHPVDGPGATS